MICKECGAYNSDHASYCKVCAAALKGDVSENDAEIGRASCRERV